MCVLNYFQHCLYTHVVDSLSCLSLSLQYTITEFSDAVFGQVLKYLITGSCSIQPSTIVGITCAAEHYEIPELKQACFDQLSNCLMAKSVCKILTQLERYLSYHCAKTMVVRTLEFVDSNADDILVSEDFLNLSENMVHLILRRDIEVQEILKVNAALAWTTKNIKPSKRMEGEREREERKRERRGRGRGEGEERGGRGERRGREERGGNKILMLLYKNKANKFFTTCMH